MSLNLEFDKDTQDQEISYRPRRRFLKYLGLGSLAGWLQVGCDGSKIQAFSGGNKDLHKDELERHKSLKVFDRVALNNEKHIISFGENAEEVYAAHFAQTIETIEQLKAKYSVPLIGEIDVVDALGMLSNCIDETDLNLGCVSQLVHVLQVINSLEDSGNKDPDMWVAALVHDFGKILSTYGEAEENVVCVNVPVQGEQFEKNIGWDNVTFQWNHDEFAYQRFKDLVPDHVSWLIRYHSNRVSTCKHLMDDRDREYYEKYLKTFYLHDVGSKSLFNIPKRKVDYYSDFLREYFPKPIVI